MVRKSISLCIALIFGGQASASGALSTDTIVTEENVNQVIEYLGLDPRDLKKADAVAFSDDSVTVTVGELEQAPNQLKQLPKEVTSTESLYTEFADGITTNSYSCSSPERLACRARYE
ncbi:hypothetical protein [Paenibacillus sp. S-12]|uniref:hypothetical protein n=1 Tax=Paenibacillus sp. S-12 TaxID=3031371 RepID=UPI0025A0E988|nr:hypothetical protein [Paenibacillus sp. S-12]